VSQCSANNNKSNINSAVFSVDSYNITIYTKCKNPQYIEPAYIDLKTIRIFFNLADISLSNATHFTIECKKPNDTFISLITGTQSLSLLQTQYAYNINDLYLSE
jgi:hypothetical protein